MSSIKQQLLTLCRQKVEASLADSENAIADARSAVHNETKSSAGDKYETGREMLQQEIELHMTRITELRKSIAALDLLEHSYNKYVGPGGLITTSIGTFYMSVGIGKLSLHGMEYHTLTAFSPLGKLLLGKTAGETVLMNGKQIQILSVE